jgi:general secretion pathway protein G
MLLHQPSNRRRRAAFTLMEMLIVVAIIVMLAGVGGYYLMGALSGGQKDAAFLQTKVLTGACTGYAAKHGDFPDQLADLLKKDETGGPYLDDPDALLDPWTKASAPRPYQYDKSGPNNGGLKPDIWTTDPKDGKKIGNWPKSANVR